MRIFTKSLLALALTVVCVGGAKAVNPDAISTCVYSTNYASWGTSLPAGWHQENCTVSVGGGILSIVNETDQGQYNDWKAQALVASGITSKVGNDYIVRIKFKGNVAGTVQCLFGTWGNTLSSPLSISTDWQTIDLPYSGALSASSFVMFHLGHYVGTIEVEKTEVYDYVRTPLYVSSTDYISWGTSLPAGWHQENCTVSVGGGILSIVNETDQGQYNDWKAQALVASGVTSKVGNDYIVRIKFKGNVAGTVQCLFGTWGNTLSSPLSVSTDWQTIDVLFDGALSASSFVMFHLGHYEGTIEVESVEVYDNVAARFVKIGENGFATFGTDKAVNVEGIVTAYGAKYDGEKIVLTQVTEIPAGAGVIVEAAEDNYKVPVIESAASIDEVNDLLVSDGSVAGDGSTIYALGKKEDKVGFVKVKNGVTIPSGKAYLIVSASARDFIGFADDDVTSVNVVKGQKKEGRSEYFNLAGLRVAQPTKGLYIVNGKKVILK